MVTSSLDVGIAPPLQLPGSLQAVEFVPVQLIAQLAAIVGAPRLVHRIELLQPRPRLRIGERREVRGDADLPAA